MADPGCDGFSSARDARYRLRYRNWTLAATLVYLGAAAALRWRAALPAALPWLLVGATALLLLQATRSYVVFLRHADELLRKIETEALAMGFGVGVLVSLLSPLAERLGAPRLYGNLTVLLMVLAWAAGVGLGRRRYGGDASA